MINLHTIYFLQRYQTQVRNLLKKTYLRKKKYNLFDLGNFGEGKWPALAIMG